MSKLKLALALPIIQLLLTVSLFMMGNHAHFPKGWDTPATSPLSLVCIGISAPAFPLVFLAPLMVGAWYPGSVLGLGLPQALFLPGVAAVWYLTGRWLDRRRSHAAPIERKITPSKLFVNFLQLMLGVFLFLAGLTAIRRGVWLRPSSDLWAY